MPNKKLPEDFVYLADMYRDSYYPTFLVDKVKAAINEVVDFLEQTKGTNEEIQTALDEMTNKINDLIEEFADNKSDIETVARESIAETVDNILKHFNIEIDIEEAIRERDW